GAGGAADDRRQGAGLGREGLLDRRQLRLGGALRRRRDRRGGVRRAGARGGGVLEDRHRLLAPAEVPPGHRQQNLQQRGAHQRLVVGQRIQQTHRRAAL